MNRIYFDNGATTPVLPEVLEAMAPYFTKEYGNASSIHQFGINARRAIEKARDITALLIGTNPSNIIFTGSGTESDNLAIQGCIRKFKDEEVHIITSIIEHPAVYNTCRFLESIGYQVSYLPVDREGIISLNDLEGMIQENTRLVTIHYANNEIGTIQPIKEIGDLLKDREILFHTDAVQALGRKNINVENEGIGLLSGSAHKLYAPKGVGFLFVRDIKDLVPIMFGGPHEMHIRPATENVPGIVGLGKAIEIISIDQEREIERERKLRDYLIDHVLAEIPGCELNGSRKFRLPNNANFRFQGVSGYELVLALDREGIACSAGSACHSHAVEPSRVLLALGLSNKQANSSLRITLGRQNTKEDVDYFLEILPRVVKELRN
ncbi:MAG: cysteine desulfurase family protein, partial [Promethearchaeota archaeon]